MREMDWPRENFDIGLGSGTRETRRESYPILRTVSAPNADRTEIDTVRPGGYLRRRTHVQVTGGDMKLATYSLDGRLSYGVVEGNGVIDLGRRIGARHPDLRTLITAQALDEAKRAAAGAKPDASLDAITFLPVIPNPDKIVCVGLNYEEHRVETNRDKTENPALFLRVPGSQLGHKQPLIQPRESKMLDYEGEIAVIIGTGGRRIAESDAWRHIVGYACYNDGSVRDFQRHTVQWTAG